jgi:hypothetical protein
MNIKPKPKTISLAIRAQDDPLLQTAREEAAIGLDPLPLALLIESVMVSCLNNQSLTDRLVQASKSRGGGAQGDVRFSSVVLDSRVCSWISRTLPDLSQKTATNYLVRWIAEEWDVIRETLPIRSGELSRRLNSLDSAYPLPEEK